MTFTREWMYKIGTGEFYDGIEEFMKQADSFARSKGFVDGTVQCPCNSCKNLSWKGIEDAKYDLYRYGFVPNYYVWDKHGEQPSQRINREMPNRAKAVNLARNMVIDAAGSQFEDLIFEAPTPPEPPNPAAKRFFDLLSKADAPLYKGCEGHSTLSATSRMLNIKSDFNMSQTCYDRVMQAIKEFIPRSTMCSNYYESKKMVSQLGLGCDHARYKPKEQGSLNGKDISYKSKSFFRDLCSTTLKVEQLEKMERNIVVTMCKLEKILPPGFFDHMEHLLVHLSYEARVGGPEQYRWMYPFERKFEAELKVKMPNMTSVQLIRATEERDKNDWWSVCKTKARSTIVALTQPIDSAYQEDGAALPFLVTENDEVEKLHDDEGDMEVVEVQHLQDHGSEEVEDLIEEEEESEEEEELEYENGSDEDNEAKERDEWLDNFSDDDYDF
ncbi:putative reverse transcriptase, RNA-dependent DNA polymerase, LTR copia-type gag-polypeptide [Tanacetum coccineum]